jgi:hypothetical protein
MKNKLWKLAQMLIQFKKYVTDNGVLVIDGDLAEGVEVSVENENGDLEPAADGEYELGDNLKISVADGKVTTFEYTSGDYTATFTGSSNTWSVAPKTP